MRRLLITVSLFIFLFSTIPSAYADRGMIPVDPEVSVYEPGQKAIIAWNGEEEILILSTDVTSSGETFAIEILPLPSNPGQVELANFKSFEEIQNLILRRGVEAFGKTLGERGTADFEVVFHERLGAHDITVVKANDGLELVGWMEKFLQGTDVSHEISLRSFESVIEDYMTRGFRYYVLDVITVSSEERSVEPILYRFETSSLYYPLLITSPVEGDTKIKLFILTDSKIRDDYTFHPLMKAGYRTEEGWKPIELQLSNGELSKIDLRISKLLEDGAWLTVLKYEGKLATLTEDLIMPVEATASTVVNLNILTLFKLEALCALLGAICTLVGVVSTFLIMRWKTEKTKA